MTELGNAIIVMLYFVFVISIAFVLMATVYCLICKAIDIFNYIKWRLARRVFLSMIHAKSSKPMPWWLR